MIILGVIVSIALLAVIIRFALSPQTDKLVKRAALIALGAISLAIVACLVLLITGPKAVEEEEVFAGLPLAEPVAVANPNRVYMLVVGFIMLLFVGLIIFLSLREEKKNRPGGVKRPG
jgi:multisubunit Na+/H+ antiporter MnhF subunit